MSMPTRVVFISYKPKFAILTDKYNWIIAKSGRRQKTGYVWTNREYHPNLSNLLDALAETYFKKKSKQLKTLQDLDKSIIRTYRLIERVSKKLEHLTLKKIMKLQ